MASLRELRNRIKSVNSTKKITKAQELIATSRITKAQARVEASLPYANEIHDVIERLASASSLDHPMLRERENANRAAILVVSSDRGMAGGYNYNVFKKTRFHVPRPTRHHHISPFVYRTITVYGRTSQSVPLELI